jgi:hypothetical protein
MKLEELAVALSNKHPRLVANLNPPNLIESQLREMFSEVYAGYEMPEELVSLYEWKNGTQIKFKRMEVYNEIKGESCIIPAWIFIEFSLAVKKVKENPKVFKRDRKVYFPFLYTGFGHYLCFQLKLKGSSDFRSRGIYLSTRPQRKIYGNYLYYRNFEIFLESIVRCCNEGVYYEINDHFGGNVLRESEINCELTPNSSIWNLKKFGVVKNFDVEE